MEITISLLTINWKTIEHYRVSHNIASVNRTKSDSFSDSSRKYLEAIILTDVDFAITYINKVGEKFFGYTLNKLKGKRQVFSI